MNIERSKNWIDVLPSLTIGWKPLSVFVSWMRWSAYWQKPKKVKETKLED